MGSVYIDEILCFESNGNAIKAAALLNRMGYINVVIYESVVLVSFDSSYEKPQFPNRTMKELIDKATQILEKYSIKYTFKNLTF